MVVDGERGSEGFGTDLDERYVGTVAKLVAINPTIPRKLAGKVGFGTWAVWGEGRVVGLGVAGDLVLEAQAIDGFSYHDFGFHVCELDGVAGRLWGVEVVDDQDSRSTAGCSFQLGDKFGEVKRLSGDDDVAGASTVHPGTLVGDELDVFKGGSLVRMFAVVVNVKVL